MKKLIIVLFFLPVILFAQTVESKGDVWDLSFDTNQNGKTMYCRLDMQESKWSFNYKEEMGLHGVMFVFNERPDGVLEFVVSYKSDYGVEHNFPHYVLINNNDFDFQLIGGQKTSGDRSIYDADEGEGASFNIIYINLDGKEKSEFLSIEEDIEVFVDDYGGLGIIYGLPKEVFEVFNNFIEEIEYEKNDSDSDDGSGHPQPRLG